MSGMWECPKDQHVSLKMFVWPQTMKEAQVLRFGAHQVEKTLMVVHRAGEDHELNA